MNIHQIIIYININLHDRFTNTFLCINKINGNFDVDATLYMLKGVLIKFEINIEKNVISCITDGESLMIKFGK